MSLVLRDIEQISQAGLRYVWVQKMEERIFKPSIGHRVICMVGALIMAYMGMAILFMGVTNPEEISLITAVIFGVILMVIAVFMVATFIRLSKFSVKVGAKEVVFFDSKNMVSYSFERYRFAGQIAHRRNSISYILIITDNGGNEVRQKTNLKKKEFESMIQLIEQRKMYRGA